MGFRLGSQELANEFLRLQDENAETQAKLKGLSIRLIMLGLDAPGNEDKQLAINVENGRFIDIQVQTKPAPSDLRTAPFDKTKYDARVMAPQQTFIDLINGKIDLLSALDKVKINGDMGKLMAQFAGFVAFIDFIGSMGIEP